MLQYILLKKMDEDGNDEVCIGVFDEKQQAINYASKSFSETFFESSIEDGDDDNVTFIQDTCRYRIIVANKL